MAWPKRILTAIIYKKILLWYKNFKKKVFCFINLILCLEVLKKSVLLKTIQVVGTTKLLGELIKEK